MSSAEVCCSTPAVTSNYEPVGTVETISGSGEIPDLPVYTVGPADAKKAVVVIYDIFGFLNNTKQFCDVLAKVGGYKVVMPDFFRGKPWTAEQGFGDMPKLMAWISKVGSFKILEPQLALLREDLKKQGIAQAGIVGFCWGAKIAVQSTAVDSFYGGASLIHPSAVDNKDAEAAKAPILAIPSKDEPDMTEYMNILSKKSFGAQCKHHRFDDMPHGFCAGRGDFSNELNNKRTTEAIRLTVDFFQEVLTL